MRHGGLGTRRSRIDDWLVTLRAEDVALDPEEGVSAFRTDVREHGRA